MPDNAFDANTLFNSNSLNPRAAGPAVFVPEQPRLRRKIIRNPAVSSVPAKEAINGPLGRALATGQVVPESFETIVPSSIRNSPPYHLSLGPEPPVPSTNGPDFDRQYAARQQWLKARDAQLTSQAAARERGQQMADGFNSAGPRGTYTMNQATGHVEQPSVVYGGRPVAAPVGGSLPGTALIGHSAPPGDFAARQRFLDAAYGHVPDPNPAPRVLSHEETLLALMNAGKSRFDEGSHADIMPGGTVIVGHRLIGPGAADPAVMSPRSIGTAGESARQLAAIQRNNASMEEARNRGDGFGQQVAQQEQQEKDARKIIRAKAMNEAIARNARLTGTDPMMSLMMGGQGGDMSLAVLNRFGPTALEAYQRGREAESRLQLGRDQLASQNQQRGLDREHEMALQQKKIEQDERLAQADAALKRELQGMLNSGQISAAEAQHRYALERDKLNNAHAMEVARLNQEAGGTVADKAALALIEAGQNDMLSDEQKRRFGMAPDAGTGPLARVREAKAAGVANPEEYAKTHAGEEAIKKAVASGKLDDAAAAAFKDIFLHDRFDESSWPFWNGRWLNNPFSNRNSFISYFGQKHGPAGAELAREWWDNRNQ